jgi:hypothetical protein
MTFLHTVHDSLSFDLVQSRQPTAHGSPHIKTSYTRAALTSQHHVPCIRTTSYSIHSVRGCLCEVAFLRPRNSQFPAWLTGRWSLHDVRDWWHRVDDTSGPWVRASKDSGQFVRRRLVVGELECRTPYIAEVRSGVRDLCCSDCFVYPA